MTAVASSFPRSVSIHHRVVRAAALALCSLTLKCQANKTRCASLDAVPILLELGAAWGVTENGDDYLVARDHHPPPSLAQAARSADHARRSRGGFGTLHPSMFRSQIYIFRTRSHRSDEGHEAFP